LEYARGHLLEPLSFIRHLTYRPPNEVVAEEFGVLRFVNVVLPPRYNVAPSQFVETIIRGGDKKRLGPGTVGMTMAGIARELVSRNPELACPEGKDE
jgi:hypothetical protein